MPGHGRVRRQVARLGKCRVDASGNDLVCQARRSYTHSRSTESIFCLMHWTSRTECGRTHAGDDRHDWHHIPRVAQLDARGESGACASRSADPIDEALLRTLMTKHRVRLRGCIERCVDRFQYHHKYSFNPAIRRPAAAVTTGQAGVRSGPRASFPTATARSSRALAIPPTTPGEEPDPKDEAAASRCAPKCRRKRVCGWFSESGSPAEGRFPACPRRGRRR